MTSEATNEATRALSQIALRVEKKVQGYPPNLHDWMRSFYLEKALIEGQKKRSHWAHQSYHALVEDLSATGPREVTLHLPPDIPEGEVQQCYNNALDLAALDGELIYCEGFAGINEFRGLLIRHAWVETPEGEVIDPTWGARHAGETAWYYGIRFDLPFCLTQVLKYGWSSILETDVAHGECEILASGLQTHDGIAYAINNRGEK